VPHLGEAWHNVTPPTGEFGQNWNGFVEYWTATSDMLVEIAVEGLTTKVKPET
jgi:hypothetical protein